MNENQNITSTVPTGNPAPTTPGTVAPPAKKTGKKRVRKDGKAEAKRLARNKYSRQYKADRKVMVRAHNKAWSLEQAGKKKEADAMRKKVANGGWKNFNWVKGQLVAKVARKRTAPKPPIGTPLAPAA